MRRRYKKFDYRENYTYKMASGELNDDVVRKYVKHVEGNIDGLSILSDKALEAYIEKLGKSKVYIEQFLDAISPYKDFIVKFFDASSSLGELKSRDSSRVNIFNKLFTNGVCLENQNELLRLNGIRDELRHRILSANFLRIESGESADSVDSKIMYTRTKIALCIQDRDKVDALINRCETERRSREDRVLEKHKKIASDKSALAAAHLNKSRELAQFIKEKLLPDLKNNPFCPYCFIPMGNVEFVADHIYPVSKGGLSTIENMVYVCEKCNQRKGNKTLFAFCSDEGHELNRVLLALRSLKKDV